MKLVTSKAFRSRMNEFAARAEMETIYITRPGGKLLCVTSVPSEDVAQIKMVCGEPEKALSEKEF